MFQMNEVMTLIFDLIGLVLLIFFLKSGSIPRFPFLTAAYCFILASNTFTVLEGFWLYDLFNMLEHAFYLAAAACVLIGVVNYARAGMT